MTALRFRDSLCYNPCMTLKPNEPCPHCGRYLNRWVTVDAIIIQDKQILLILRGTEPFKDFWALPGGLVDWDETIAEAIKREVKEELGLTVVSQKELGVYSDPARSPHQTINIAFFVEVEGEPQAGDDAKACQYFPLDKLPEEMAFDHKKIVEDFLSTFKLTNSVS